MRHSAVDRAEPSALTNGYWHVRLRERACSDAEEAEGGEETLMPRSTRYFSWLILGVVATAACAPLRGTTAPELAGTPSVIRCDAWFGIGGTFSRLNDGRYTLGNRSTSSACFATRVVMLFDGPLRPAAFRVSVPSGWMVREVPCQPDGGVCGFEWRAHGGGVPPGEQLAGFGLAYDPAGVPQPKAWLIDVGPRRIEMPIGRVAG